MQLLHRGAGGAALWRLRNIVLRPLSGAWRPASPRVRRATTAAGDTVSIGDVHFKLKQPKHPELVPLKHILEPLPQALVQHLRWIMQKDLLGQDVFLIGPPGPLRRSIAMQYLELTKREAEYMALSRDTTETDLKQRREIRAGTAFYVDQCAVRAATEGRILVLEGLEKAERNVLPVLNNLLENREMQLEDGRFLMSAERYDKLLKEHTKEELDVWKIVRVSEDFRVIALGLPVPRYPGNPLDPPLRSRFQARDIYCLPFKDHLTLLYAIGPNVPTERISQMLSFAMALCTQESTSLGLPEFPVDNLPAIIKIMDAFPMMSAQQLLHRLYPYDLMLGKEGVIGVEDVLKTFDLLDSASTSSPKGVTGIKKMNGETSRTEAIVQIGDKEMAIKIPTGTKPSKFHTKSSNFIKTSSHNRLLAEMMQSHMVKDMCLIGGKGCGKTVISKEFADLLGYSIEPITLYQDMTARDLLQQRYTLPNGDTAWRPAPLVTAALSGKLVVLDGIHRVNPGTLAILQRLIHDRELTLYDGSHLLRADRYQDLKRELNLADNDLQQRLIYPIHPSFRILALAEPPAVGSSTQQWLGSELLTMFLFHNVKPLSMKEEFDVITKMIPRVQKDAVSQLLQFTHRLRQSSDPTAKSLASSLSLRQLLRICNRISRYPEESLYHAVNKACLSRFLPNLARSALQKNLKDSGIEANSDVEQERTDIKCEIKSGILTIGKVSVPLHNPDEKMKVPDTLFYENTQHMQVMEDLLKDFLLGEHLLLVGNQGVGKNKIVDYFLHLLNRPREYLQLHRDTTVQSLTLQPSVQHGVITYEDSPLVRAVKRGHILVIDEADKAPTNVTCILKTLVESGEMILSDGRRIVVDQASAEGRTDVIVIHPDFRMIVLANRPGFPFLGNDFFGALGDIFSCSAVDNPKPQSELAMLRQYGPDVPEQVLKKLVSAFGELRNMADQGIITYPYSTREVVNIVKHLQEFPTEGLANVVRNVFDFDSYNSEMREILISTLHKHGIPIGAKPTNVQLAKELPLPECKLSSYWTFNQPENAHCKILCPTESRQTLMKGPLYLKVQDYPLERHESRGLNFTEEQAHWTIPLNEVNIVCDVATIKGETTDTIYVATCNPVSLYSMDVPGSYIQYMDLYDIFPRNTSRVWQPFVTVAPLSQSLHNQVILHEEQSNVILLINLNNGAVSRIIFSGKEQEPPKKAHWWANKEDKVIYKMCREFSHKNWLVFYKERGNSLDVLDVLEGQAYSLSLPISVKSVHLVAEDRWLLVESKTNKKFLLMKSMHIGYDSSGVCELHAINEEPVHTGFGISAALELLEPCTVSKEELSPVNLSAALGQKIASPNRILSDENSFATIVVGFPDLMSPNEVYTWKRKAQLDRTLGGSSTDKLFYGSNLTRNVKQTNCVTLTGTNQVIRAVAATDVPLNEIYLQDVKPPDTTVFLEVTDLNTKKIKYVPIPRALSVSPYTQWLSQISDTEVLIAPMGTGGVVSVDLGGHVRLWETGFHHIQHSLLEWRNMIGQQDGRPIQITIQRDSGLDVTAPKHGRVDLHNAPHVGGNTWAGGTGGRDTAGLGGKGGPYRLDAGHKVYQVSQAERDAVPAEVKRAAREMAEKAFKERLKEINMSEYDAATYERFSGAVWRQVQSIRVILDSLQAKGKERQWLRHQSIGELDDTKIIDGLTGEKAIYKRRGELEPELGSPQQKPKRLRLLVDVSGSMYRFNGLDGRLERSMEAVCMVLEAFENYEQKLKYDIVGHSGDGFNIELVRSEHLPKNNKERLRIIKIMYAHAQFCMSGDHTLEGTEHAIQEIAKEEADEHFVIVLSDANLERYGISSTRFARALTCNPQVNAFAIFIGSLGDQAERLQQTLPAGRSFVAMDTKQIPQILQQIFTSTLLSTT
ncbi:von Willebrand factor A domain-containing protein 8 [Hypanus sabinus]|uniref:von Willebrand factor A domain-containing protein 8 n=1 Tax=Hypanus sabinus TaxID=79690 RepID=UPI0028C4E368|nr:von Willebrand factor A domain-containing protein 8 [Hypanus sabinus]